MKTLILELRAPSGAVSLGLLQLIDALDRDVRDRVCVGMRGGGGTGDRKGQWKKCFGGRNFCGSQGTGRPFDTVPSRQLRSFVQDTHRQGHSHRARTVEAMQGTGS